jgi:5-methylcytosine-specific restriction enzyme A
MSDRKRLSTRERVQCFEDGHGECHLCFRKIFPGEVWEVSHPIPLAAGGTDTRENRRPAHKKCHARQTAELDIPLIAKTKRIRARHIGARAPSAHPMPGSKASGLRRRMNGTVERRTP